MCMDVFPVYMPVLPHVCSACRDEERLYDPLGVELQTVVHCYLCAGPQTLVPWKRSQSVSLTAELSLQSPI